MKLQRSYSLQEIANLLSADFVGDPAIIITGINEIHMVEEGDLAFVDHPKYYEKTLASSASVILINKSVDRPVNKGLIVHEHPFDAFNFLTNHFKPFKPANSLKGKNATIGKGTLVQPNVFIGEDVSIGENCLIHPGVVIYNGVTIGNNVTIHANTSIGSDAFYYKRGSGLHQKLNTVGTVIIDDHVDIGASCTIDAGATSATKIGLGTKIDNQVQIGHDTVIGSNCIIAAQTGIAGCVVIEDEVTIWGQVGITANVKLAKGCEVYAQSGVMRNVPENQKVFGSPAKEARLKMRELAAISRLT
jgi:UDP-3-O-[3-hydroxymyristoyl] glucosamine N-acyltransferase